MNCREVEEREILERYLLDQLTELERDEFETHYFECKSCFSKLQTGLTVREELRHKQFVRSPTAATAHSRLTWAWASALAALALIVVMGISWYSAREHQSSRQASLLVPHPNAGQSGASQLPLAAAPSLKELARVEAPPYSAVVLRGTEDEAQENFRTAMQHYLRGDYAKAVPGLRAAVKASPRIARFRYYLAACYLLTEQSDSAIDSFRQTVSLGDPAYSQPAHFYLAKAYLQKGDVSAAEEELRTTVRLGGSKAPDAAEILRQLHK